MIAVQKDLVELGDSPSLGGGLVLRHVLQHHVHEVIEAEQCSDDLLVALHDDVDAGADALVYQLCVLFEGYTQEKEVINV